MKINNLKTIIPILILALVSFAFMHNDGNKSRLQKTTLKAGDSYRLFINNIDMPINNEGVMADVLIGGRDGGRLDGKVFLYSGGFFLSGKTKGKPWANAVASASRINDYISGTVASPDDPNAVVYVLAQKDGDFAPSWNEWKDAVALGAYYYDGDANGIYNPIDLNGNGKWDNTEDRPDLIGDETVWCVYNDGRSPALRRWSDINPQGVEIRQSVFAFRSKGVTGNMIFIRYSIVNSGLLADTLDDVYFGVWADPDLGNENDAYLDDLVGCDTTLNAGFVYNDGDDADWGLNPPCFVIDFFQGPVSYLPGVTFTDNNDNKIFDAGDTPLDTAYNVRGQVRKVDVIPGAKNLGLSSFVHYMQSHPTVGDPDFSYEARNYMLGFDKVGNRLNPCTWPFGVVNPASICAQVDPKFWYSGDPVTGQGWLNNGPKDQRQMSNTGPFKLIKGQPQDIVVAYVVGRGNNALESVAKAKDYDKVAQILFDANFPSPPAPPLVELTTRNGNNFIDLSFDTYEQFQYNAVDTVLDIDRKLQGFYITAYKKNSKEASINGIQNSIVVAEYQVNNFIQNVYQVVGSDTARLLISNLDASKKLSPAVYSDPASGRLRVRIDKDPFTKEELVKGHEYYFSVTQYHLNHKAIVNRGGGAFGTAGDYKDPGGGALDEYETQNYTVVFGEDQYDPSFRGLAGNQVSGFSNGAIKVLTVTPEELTGDNYAVEFFKDNSIVAGQTYSAFWRLKNETTGQVLIDSSKTFDFDTTLYAGKVTEGFLVKVQSSSPSVGLSSPVYTPEDNEWYAEFRTDSSTGVYYVGRDNSQGSAIKVGTNSNARSNYIRSDKLRKVELRFGPPNFGKAYRYLNGYVGTNLTRLSNFVYANGIVASDTVGRGKVGNWDEVNNRANGFVDVPFQAWIVDSRTNEEKQLAVGFIEITTNRGAGNPPGTPDGSWDPGTTATPEGNEVIAIFDKEYDPTGSQIEFTGNSTKWADILKGFTLSASGATQDQISIAASPWFNAMYVVGLKRKVPGAFYTPGDKFTVSVTRYPYTEKDKFSFSTIKAGDLTSEQKKALFDKVNVFPNPLFGYNPATSYSSTGSPDQPFVTFSNLPPSDVTIKIYSLSGSLIRTLTSADKASLSSTFLRWDLENEEGLRVASGLYLAIVSVPGFGEKILKFSIVMPQKQIQRF